MSRQQTVIKSTTTGVKVSRVAEPDKVGTSLKAVTSSLFKGNRNSINFPIINDVSRH